MDDNMGPERDANLYQPAGELEQIKDANVPSLHFPLLFPHGELGWHVAVRYQGDDTSHNNNRISRRNLPHTDSDQVQWVLIAPSRCKIVSVRSFHTNYRNACA